MATDDHMTVTAVGIPSGAVSASLGKYTLENGQHIEDVVLGYSTYGTLNEVRSGS
jgi:homoserine acetyltransferase|tara:strand:- start:3470 stop:3634 length:165 start_codon:yes stop_codon:yes gene_type:complete